MCFEYCLQFVYCFSLSLSFFSSSTSTSPSLLNNCIMIYYASTVDFNFLLFCKSSLLTKIWFRVWFLSSHFLHTSELHWKHNKETNKKRKLILLFAHFLLCNLLLRQLLACVNFAPTNFHHSTILFVTEKTINKIMIKFRNIARKRWLCWMYSYWLSLALPTAHLNGVNTLFLSFNSFSSLQQSCSTYLVFFQIQNRSIFFFSCARVSLVYLCSV